MVEHVRLDKYSALLPLAPLSLQVPFSLLLSSRATTEGEDIFCPFARRAIESETEGRKGEKEGLFIVLAPSLLSLLSRFLGGGRRLDRLNKCN